MGVQNKNVSKSVNAACQFFICH